jgi:hypothetical protein
MDAHTENYNTPVNGIRGDQQQWQAVAAEIRGREKPDEWVLLGAHLDGSAPSLEQAYNAALVIDAARDIQLTGIHPRRSIRFVLFDSGEHRMDGALDYVQGHRDELNHLSATLIFSAAADHLNGFALNGRHDIETGVREALQPIYAMGITHHTLDSPLDRYSVDFILQGIPTLLTPHQEPTGGQTNFIPPRVPEKGDLQELKRNTSIAAVAAFGIAELAEPLGPRQSRAEIEILLKSSGLDEQMKTSGLWSLWESGERGRLP